MILVAVSRDFLTAALRNSCGPHDARTFEVSFEFPTGCKVMVDAAIRLLALANQLASTTRRVRLNFEEGELGTMGYLNRLRARQFTRHPCEFVVWCSALERVRIDNVNADTVRTRPFMV